MREEIKKRLITEVALKKYEQKSTDSKILNKNFVVDYGNSIMFFNKYRAILTDKMNIEDIIKYEKSGNSEIIKYDNGLAEMIKKGFGSVKKHNIVINTNSIDTMIIKGDDDNFGYLSFNNYKIKVNKKFLRPLYDLGEKIEICFNEGVSPVLVKSSIADYVFMPCGIIEKNI